MFGTRKTEPETARYDPAARLAAKRAAQAVETPAPSRPVDGLAHYLSRPNHPALPPADLVAEFDPDLADLIETANQAVGEAMRAVLEWEAHQPGAAGFMAVVAQQRTWAEGFLEDGKEIPTDGPLLDWLTVGVHELLVATVNARIRSDHTDRAVRQFVSQGLRDRLHAAAVEVLDQMRAHFEECRVEKSARAYQRAVDLYPSYNRINNLAWWAVNPRDRYSTTAPGAMPQAVEVEEYDAATEGLGEQRSQVPDDKVGIPQPGLAARYSTTRSETSIHWGPDGPPGSQRASGVT